MKNEVILLITAPNPYSAAESKFLLARKGDKLFLPSDKLSEDESSIQCASRLLKVFTGADARLRGVGWIDLNPTPVVDSIDRKDADGTRWVAIPYWCMMPFEVTEKPFSKKDEWLTFTNLCEKKSEIGLDHFEIIMVISRSI